MKTIELKTSKKFKELGVTKKSYALWRHRSNDEDTAYIITQNCIDDCYLTTNDDILYPAYTLDEILEMLPFKEYYYDDDYNYNNGDYCQICQCDTCEYKASYIINDYKKCEERKNKNPAEAAAQLLIWCIENGYVKVEEINDE